MAHEQSGVGGGPVLELFEGEASRESGNVTWESFVHGVEIDICCMQQRGAGEPQKCLEIFQAKGASARSARSSAVIYDDPFLPPGTFIVPGDHEEFNKTDSLDAYRNTKFTLHSMNEGFRQTNGRERNEYVGEYYRLETRMK